MNPAVGSRWAARGILYKACMGRDHAPLQRSIASARSTAAAWCGQSPHLPVLPSPGVQGHTGSKWRPASAANTHLMQVTLPLKIHLLLHAVVGLQAGDALDQDGDGLHDTADDLEDMLSRRTTSRAHGGSHKRRGRSRTPSASQRRIRRQRAAEEPGEDEAAEEGGAVQQQRRQGASARASSSTMPARVIGWRERPPELMAELGPAKLSQQTARSLFSIMREHQLLPELSQLCGKGKEPSPAEFDEWRLPVPVAEGAPLAAAGASQQAPTAAAAAAGASSSRSNPSGGADTCKCGGSCHDARAMLAWPPNLPLVDYQKVSCSGTQYQQVVTWAQARLRELGDDWCGGDVLLLMNKHSKALELKAAKVSCVACGTGNTAGHCTMLSCHWLCRSHLK